MKIRLISDVHHEFYEDKNLYEPLGEDVLVIAGDLHSGKERGLASLKRFGERNERVIYVPGNHEYYGGSIPETDDYLRRNTRDSNITILNPSHTVVDGVAFIGAALWTNFRKDAMAKMRCTSHTQNHAIQVWLGQGRLKEIK